MHLSHTCLLLSITAAGLAAMGCQERSLSTVEVPAPELNRAVKEFASAHPALLEYSPSKPDGDLSWTDAQRTVLAADTAAPATRPVARKIVYNATLSVAVTNIPNASEKAEAMAGALGGYVQKVETRGITLRVPAEQFRKAVDFLSSFGAVTKKNIEAQDVTEEYLDVELRLNNARVMIKRLEELLALAKDVKDTLAIEKELNRVRGELERLEGKLRFLTSQIAYSTITVTWEQIQQSVTRGQRPPLPFDWLRQLGVENVMEVAKW